VASLTIRGLDDALKSRLRMEAARRGLSMEETARQILRRALIDSELEPGGLGTLIHSFFTDADAFDLKIPARSLPRSAPEL
jgi:antitoxin FitA